MKNITADFQRTLKKKAIYLKQMKFNEEKELEANDDFETLVNNETQVNAEFNAELNANEQSHFTRNVGISALIGIGVFVTYKYYNR